MLSTIIAIVAVLLVAAGIVSSIVPPLPGPPLAYAGMLVLHFGWGDVFSTTTLVAFAVLTAIAIVIDYALPVVGAKMYGATKQGIIGSVIGSLVGLVVLSLPGMMLGLFIGAVIGEYIAGQETSQALRSGMASFIGSIAAMAAKAAVCVAMLFFVVKSFF